MEFRDAVKFLLELLLRSIDSTQQTQFKQHAKYFKKMVKIDRYAVTYIATLLGSRLFGKEGRRPLSRSLDTPLRYLVVWDQTIANIEYII